MSKQILVDHKTTWENKKIIRDIYTEWYKMIEEELSPGDKPTLEIGAGTGNFKSFHMNVIATDIVPCDWLDLCLDAHAIPFPSGTFSNIILVDVLHHLADPIQFLNEAYRVLKTGGKIFLLEPYPSFIAKFIYKLFHPEPFIFDIDYFEPNRKADLKDPWDANQAVAYLLFYKNPDIFRSVYRGRLNLEKQERISFLLYPLSGGFTRPQLIPDLAVPSVKVIERILKPFASLLAFRCYIVLSRV